MDQDDSNICIVISLTLRDTNAVREELRLPGMPDAFDIRQYDS